MTAAVKYFDATYEEKHNPDHYEHKHNSWRAEEEKHKSIGLLLDLFKCYNEKNKIIGG